MKEAINLIPTPDLYELSADAQAYAAAVAQVAISDADLKIWVDASVLTQADNVTMGTWLDLTANGNNFIAPSTPPVVRTNIQNSKRGVYFDNGIGMRALGPVYAANALMTVIGVLKFDNGPSAGNRRALQSWPTNSGLGTTNLAGNLRAFWVNGSPPVLTLSATQTPARFHSLTFTASTGRWICDTLTDQTGGVGHPGGQLCFGAYTIAEPMWGHWFECKVWSRVLSNTEIAAQRTVLNVKWALTGAA